MDKIEHYRRLVKQLLCEEAAVKPAADEIEPHLVFDDEHSSYQLMYIGWQGSWRMHGAVIHIRLRDGKIWIEEDGTEEGSTAENRGVRRTGRKTHLCTGELTGPCDALHSTPRDAVVLPRRRVRQQTSGCGCS